MGREIERKGWGWEKNMWGEGERGRERGREGRGLRRRGGRGSKIIFFAYISIATEAVSFTRPPVLPSVGGACVDTEGTQYTELCRLLLR